MSHATFNTLKLTEGEVMYLSGQTLNILAAQDGCYELLDAKGFFVEDEQLYKLTKNGIEKVE